MSDTISLAISKLQQINRDLHGRERLEVVMADNTLEGQIRLLLSQGVDVNIELEAAERDGVVAVFDKRA